MLNSLRYNNLITKSFFEKEYVINKKSISQISKETNKDWHTIKSYLKYYRILLRTHKEQASISSPGGKYKYNDILTKEFLVREYLKKQKGIFSLSSELKLDRGTLKRYLKRYGISIRTDKEQKRINHPSKEFDLNSETKSFIDGLLLGDASIPKRKDGIKPWSLTQACKYEEYLKYIKERFAKIGIISSPILSRWIKDERCKNGGYNQHFFQTRRYKTFESFRERWYPRDKKIIPRDLKVNPDLLLQFYLGDGNFYREIRLCSDSFNKNDNLFLKKLMETELGIQTRLAKINSKFELAIKKSDSKKLFDYIGKSPIKCYGYKWEDNESEEAKRRKRLKARLRYYRNKNEPQNLQAKKKFYKNQRTSGR